MIEKTVVLVKPDGVKRALVGEIVSRFEKVGLKIVAMKMIWVDAPHMEKHYTENEEFLRNIGENTLKTYEKYGKDPNEELGTMDPMEIGKRVRGWLIEYLTSGPVVAMVLEGIHAVSTVRKIVGKTLPNLSEPGTIRGDYTIDSPLLANTKKRPIRNVIHASGTKEEADFEVQLWFHEDEIYSYKRADEDVMFE